jgi:hypothetical protein
MHSHKKRDGLTTSRRVDGAAHALVPEAEGALVFGKELLSRVQSRLRYPRPAPPKRGPSQATSRLTDDRYRDHRST